MFKAHHYVYIAVIRNIPHTDLNTLTKLKHHLDPLSPEEISLLTYWSQLSQQQADLYPDYSPSQLAVFLSIKTGCHCPLDPISTYFKGSSGRKHLLSWYTMYQKNIHYPPFTPTSEQHAIIHTPPGLHIINAGPGTGKTTTAVHCALQYKDSGVILVSYSNEAVKEIHHKFAEQPLDRGTVSYKSFGTSPLVVSTVDSLAWHILQKPISADSDQTYDQYIQQATELLKNGYLGLFQKYHTIIVDESQDIDDLRGTLLLDCFAHNLIDRMLIFGDPRQRLNHKSGTWYVNLWETTKFTRPKFKPFTHDLIDQEYTAHKHHLSISHRFTNSQLLNLANDISSQRPPLHIQLQGPADLPPLPNAISHYSISQDEEISIQHFAHYLKSLNLSWSDIVIIIPSMHRNNVTSSKCAQLCAVLQDCNIPCYTRKEGSYLPKAILISTIHAVKGKEFNLVILYRMNGFPVGFYPIPYEDALSQIYVAHTRAKNRLIYLSNSPFVAPASVSPTHIHQHLTNIPINVNAAPPMPRPEPRMFAVSEVLVCHGWSRLAHINGYTLQSENQQDGPSIKNPGMDPRLWGILCNVVLQTILSGKILHVIIEMLSHRYLKLNTDDYIKAQRKGYIINGRWMGTDQYLHYYVISENNINNLRASEIQSLHLLVDKPIQQWNWDDWGLCTQVVDYFMGNHMLSRYTLQLPNSEFPYTEFRTIAQFLHQKYGDLVSYEKSCRFGWIAGSCDLVFAQGLIMELKTSSEISQKHRQQVFLYRILSTSQTSDIYNLTTGKIERITSKQSDMRWRYLLDCYGTIRNHVDIVTDRVNRLLMQGKKLPTNKQLFFADTEFTCIDNRHYDIFDFSLLNVADPYLSIISTYRTSNSFAVEWLTSHNEQWTTSQITDLLVSSPSVDSDILSDSFAHMPSYPMYYYIAPADAIIPRRFGLACYDLRKSMISLAKHKGVSYQSAVNIKLGEIYDVLCLPMVLQKHLHQHWALTDTLLLYELYLLGYLQL